MSTHVNTDNRVDNQTPVFTSDQTGRIDLPPEALDNEPTEFELSNESALTLNDDQISELVGGISKKVNGFLQDMAQAMREGKTPDDAFLDFGSNVMRLSNEIPMAKYGGLTWQEHHDLIYAKAAAIENDNSGKYTDETRNAVGYVKEQMSVPGNETDFTWEDFVNTVKRAESGEELEADSLEGSKRTSKPKPVKLALDGDENRDDFIRRAQALIDDKSNKIGHTMYLEEFRDDQKWEDLAVLVEAMETDDERSIDEVIVKNDKRTLSADDLEAVCQALASNMESYHLVGYLFILLGHVCAASREWNGADMQCYEIRRWMLAYNAHAADDASDHIMAKALEHLSKENEIAPESEAS